jgi:hypothetical protein
MLVVGARVAVRCGLFAPTEPFAIGTDLGDLQMSEFALQREFPPDWMPMIPMRSLDSPYSAMIYGRLAQMCGGLPLALLTADPALAGPHGCGYVLTIQSSPAILRDWLPHTERPGQAEHP